MKPAPKPSQAFPRLADIEREVVAETREWGRQRLEERLQKLAAESRAVFPPQAAPTKNPHTPKRTGGHTTGR